nr:hypothetical protein CFP56_27588 [Quercus suber]
MAPQENLVDIAKDGFALIDDYYGWTWRTDKKVPKKQAEITSKKAAEKYGGVLITDYPNPNGKKPVQYWTKY